MEKIDYGTLLNLSDSNDSVSTETHRKYFDFYVILLFGTILSFSMILAIIGNIMTIIVILAEKKLRKSTNLFLLNLAVADMLVGILVIPFSLITLIKEDWIFPAWFCDFNFCINCVCIITSVHTLMYIAVHKYICVSGVGYYFHTWKCLLMISATWIWSTTFAVLTTKVFSEVLYKQKTMQCGPKYPEDTVKSITLLAGYQTFNFYIPFIIMAIAYIRIFQVIRKSSKFRRRNSICFSGHTRKQENNLLKTLLIILFCFLLCFSPYVFYTFYSSIIKNKNDIPAFLNPLAYSFGCLNSACNPVIYAWRFPDFRKGYKQIICYKVLFIITCCWKKLEMSDKDEPSQAYNSRGTFTDGHEMVAMVPETHLQ